MNFLKNIIRSLYIFFLQCRQKLFYRKNLDVIHDYWKEPNDGHNNPKSYVINQKGHKNSKNMVSLIKELITTDGKILEIGVNAGRNLSHLYSEGYKNLFGIEISKNALNEFERSFGDCYKNSNIINDSVENAIINIDDKSIDVIYTMAVLQHIHPKSEWIFEHMSRICRGYIITFEDEFWVSDRHFPRDYKKVFEKVGMRQLYKKQGARIFKKG